MIIVNALYIGLAQEADSKTDKSDNDPVIRFEQTTFNLGKIKYKETDTYWFKFKNDGKKPLILTSVITSCGCMVLSWPKAPIEFGKTDSIKVMYDTQQEGTFSKSLRVYSNAKNSPVFLRINGQVISENR